MFPDIQIPNELAMIAYEIFPDGEVFGSMDNNDKVWVWAIGDGSLKNRIVFTLEPGCRIRVARMTQHGTVSAPFNLADPECFNRIKRFVLGDGAS